MHSKLVSTSLLKGTLLVQVYIKPRCVQCNATYRALDAQGIEYEVIDMSQHPEALDKVKSLGHLQAPVVIAPDGSHWSGFDPDRIKALAA